MSPPSLRGRAIPYNHRLREVVIDEDAHEAQPRRGRLHVVPSVRRHEKPPAMLRVVVAVSPMFSHRRPRAAILAAAGRGELFLRPVGTGPDLLAIRSAKASP